MVGINSKKEKGIKIKNPLFFMDTELLSRYLVPFIYKGGSSENGHEE
jgi:hypothetical protein